LVPCLVAALIGDWACLAWGIHHGVYRIDAQVPVDALLVAKAAIAGVAFGLAGLVFAEANHALGGWLKRIARYGPLRPVIGGIAVIALVHLFGTRDYLGLGTLAATPDGLTIASFFGPETHPWSWALKLLFTIVTLSTGFKGGEVTPLFFIGAALGNALAPMFGVPTGLFAALGFVALFAGAANTPLACTFMGIELFGAAYAVPIAVACFVAYLCSGHNGIYLSQRVAVPKVSASGLTPNTTLRDARTNRVQRRSRS
jgi:H+/Cl- antiporter ClcA